MTSSYDPDHLSSPEPIRDLVPFRDPILERPLPSSPETERAILGAIILDNSIIAEAVELLMPSDFYVPSHRKIFIAMISLFETGSEINPILIAEELRRDNSLDSCGGVLFLTNLTYGLPHVNSITQYANIVRGKSLLRQMVKVANKITGEALEEEDEPQIVLARAEKAIFDIAVEHTKKSFSLIGYLAHESLQKTYEIQESGKALTGITSGFADLDALTLGWQKSDLILIAGRPGQGKTALAVSMAINAAKLGHKVAFFSLEMPEEQIAMRALCSEARIDSRRYRSGFVNQVEWSKLGTVQQELSGYQFRIDDTPAINVLQLKAKAMRLIAEHGPLDEIIIDHIGLMGNEERSRYSSRQEEVAKISRGLKAVAKELQTPLIALCQLNRSPENRSDHRPQLADLRESGALEQDADVVAFVYRGDKYRPPNEPKDNIAEVIVAKQRNGPTDTIQLRFDDASTRFDSLSTAIQ